MAIENTESDLAQEINDARVDMQSFADFMFEPANVMVTRRLAPDINSLQHYLDYLDAIKLVFTQESGDVTVGDRTIETVQQSIGDAVETILKSGGRLGYKTYESMTAAAALPSSDPLKLPANSVIEVTNDTDATKNNVYIYDGTTFIKSNYDPTALAKTYTDTQVATIPAATLASSANLAEFQDSDGKVYAGFDKDSNLFLSNLDGKSVQAVAKELDDKIRASPSVLDSDITDILQVKDASGNVVVRQDILGDLYLPNIEGKSIQQYIKDIPKDIGLVSTNDKTNFKKLVFSDISFEYINMMVAGNVSFANVPYTSLPSSYQVPNTIVDVLKATHVTENRIMLDSPYRTNDVFVHPHIFEVTGTMRGYKYFLVINPYTTDQDENPVLYGSNDLNQFTMLDGFPQPMDTPPVGGYLSDPWQMFDPTTGEYIIAWRSTVNGAAGAFTSTYWCKRTKDMLNWTEKEEIFKGLDRVNDDMISPCVVFNPNIDKWCCWNIRGTIFDGAIYYRTADTLTGTWSTPVLIQSAGVTPWHLEVRWVGDKLVMLIFSRQTKDFYLGVSANGINWQFSRSGLFSGTATNIYKSSFLPKFEANGNLYFDLLYIAGTSSTDYGLNHTKTNSITL